MRDSFADFEQKWLAVYPENRVTIAFLPPDTRRRATAFGCLIHELSETAFHIREPQVSAAKLAWWAQELSDAAFEKPRHPITQALFDDPVACETDSTLWPALANGALTMLDYPGAGTMEGLLEAFEPFYAPVARAESALMCDGAGNIESDAALWTCSHLLQSLPRLTQDDSHLPLPLGLLARHGLTRSALLQPTPERTALIQDFLVALEREIAGALGVAAKHSLRQRVRARLDRDLIAKARKADDPLDYLNRNSQAHYWRSLWIGWREARALARNRQLQP